MSTNIIAFANEEYEIIHPCPAAGSCWSMAKRSAIFAARVVAPEKNVWTRGGALAEDESRY